MVSVYADGTVIWSRPGMVTGTCTYDMKDFPQDVQTCVLKVGSWAYDAGIILWGDWAYAYNCRSRTLPNNAGE